MSVANVIQIKTSTQIKVVGASKQDKSEQPKLFFNREKCTSNIKFVMLSAKAVFDASVMRHSLAMLGEIGDV